jgi:formamidopyrimidine-DNA glycosylase
MSGSLRILSEELPAEKHDHVDLVMSNGKVCAIPTRALWRLAVDQRWKGILRWRICPEPLSDEFTPIMQQKCAKRKPPLSPG